MTLQLAVKITGDASSLTQAVKQGKAEADSLSTSLKGTGGVAQAMAADLDRVTASTAALGAAQRTQTAVAAALGAETERVRKAVGLAEQAQASAARAASGFRPDQWKNLGYQANDIATSLASGIPITQVLAQQGGQVVQVLGEGPGGIAGGLKAVASGVASVLTPARLLAGGFIGAAASVTYLGVSWARTQEEIRTGLAGIGAMSRATAGDIEGIAERAASGGKIGRSDARGVASAVAATGQVDVANIPDIVDLAPGYAKLFGKDMKETGADLARIFADPVKGADELNARMGGLDAGTRAYIRTLADQGVRQDAILGVIRQFSPEIRAAAESTSAWAKTWELLGSVAEATGRIVAKPFVSGTTKEQLAAIEAQIRDTQAASQRSTVIGGGPDLARQRAAQIMAGLQAERDRLRQKSDEEDAAPRRKEAAALSRQAEDAVKGLQPEIDQLEKLNSKILLLQKTQGDLDALSGMSAEARNRLTSAVSAAQGGVETFITTQERARASEALTIRSIEARTVAEKAAIAAERERLGMAGQAIEGGEAERRRREEAARRAVLVQSARDSQDRLRDANDNAASAGLLPYQRQRAELEAKYRKILLQDQGNLPAIANDQKAKAAEQQALDAEAVGGPLRDANRGLTEQIAALKIQQTAFGASTEAAARLAAAQQLVNQYNAAGVPITADLRRGIEAYAATAGKVAAAQEDLVRKQREVIGGLDDMRSGARSGLTGIFSDLSQGKSPLAGITSSLGSMASRVVDRQISGPLVNSLFGQEGKAGGGIFGDALGGFFGKAQGLSKADITAGIVNLTGPVSGLGAIAANGNVPSAASVVAGLTGKGSAEAASGIVSKLSGSRAEVADYIRKASLARGIDPAVALRVVNQESGFNVAAKNLTDKEQSYGVMQLNTKGGLGVDALKAGIDVRDPSTWRSQVDFGLDTVKRDGWRQWYGARDIGVSRWEGIGKGDAPAATAAMPQLQNLDASLQSFNNSTTTATQGLTGLTSNLTALPAPLAQASQGLDQVGSSLGKGGGGGLLGALASLFGGGSATATVAAAGGGHIRGPGTSTSDSIPAWLSDGEFVINAAATKRTLPLLHAINENRMPAFAEGGLVGMAPPQALARQATEAAASSRDGSSGGSLGLNVVINNNAPGAQVTAQEVSDGRGGRRLEVQVDEAVANAVGRPGSRSSAAMAQSRLMTG